LISCVIPTIGRAELERAVCSVLQQECAEPVEVIVVNDSGKPLSPASWRNDPRVTLLNTNRRERCAARNAGAATARYPYIHFLDDDDYVLPGAYAACMEAIQRTQDSSVCWWLCDWKIRRPDGSEAVLSARDAGDWVARFMGGAGIQASVYIMRTDAFWKCGGYDPHISVMDDWDLNIRISSVGECRPVDAVMVNILVDSPATSTTRWDRVKAAIDYVREKNLSDIHIARILRRCPDRRIRGTVFRAYLGSAWWNFRGGAPTFALHRLLDGLFIAGVSAFHPLFWRGFRRIGGV
jgi:glycosyltransferase involved in cell wall biosynthesis